MVLPQTDAIGLRGCPAQVKRFLMARYKERKVLPEKAWWCTVPDSVLGQDRAGEAASVARVACSFSSSSRRPERWRRGREIAVPKGQALVRSRGASG